MKKVLIGIILSFILTQIAFAQTEPTDTDGDVWRRMAKGINH